VRRRWRWGGHRWRSGSGVGWRSLARTVSATGLVAGATVVVGVSWSSVAGATVARAPVARSRVARATVARAPVARSRVARATIARAPVARSRVAQATIARTPVARNSAARGALTLAIARGRRHRRAGPVSRQPERQVRQGPIHLDGDHEHCQRDPQRGHHASAPGSRSPDSLHDASMLAAVVPQPAVLAISPVLTPLSDSPVRERDRVTG
jgi:hypothetical protein